MAMMWRRAKKRLGIDVDVTPYMWEKKGQNIIFWFKNGDGKVAELLMNVSGVKVIWDEENDLTGISIPRELLKR